MRTWLRILTALSLPILLGLGVGWAAEQPGTGGAAAYTPCADCHDTLTAQFLTNRHATGSAAAHPGKAICESCHGDGTKHSAEGDKAFIKVPKGGEGAKACLTCHQDKSAFNSTAMGFHAAASVSCFECHSVHGAAATPLLRTATGSLCVTCHLGQKNTFGKPYAHRLGRGAIECTSCHNPHGGAGADKNLRKTAAGELPCLSCHPETQGPFVFTHVTGIAGNCMSCHEPHGSNNNKMLIRARVDQLCLECHTTLPAGTLGPQPPSFHDLRSARYTNCTGCHVAIHGSNSSPMLLR
jgi:DmsE family decaheme c-type cytochrome